MAEDDGWRQRAADARYGGALTPGFARSLAAVSATVRPAGFQKSSNVASNFVPSPVFVPMLRSAARPLTTTAARTLLRGNRQIGWALASLVMLPIAAAIGWFVQPVLSQRAYASTRITAARTLAPITAVQVPPEAVVVASPSTPAPAAVRSVTDSRSSVFEPRVVRPPHPVADPRPIERSRSETPPAVVVPLPRSDLSTPSQAPSAVVQAKGRPSFRCRPEQGAITASICNDHTLALLDGQLAARFAALDASVDPATVEALHHGETTFLNARQLCSDKACLAEVYRQRLGELENIKP